MPSNKVIAIAVVAIFLVAGFGAAFVLLGEGEESEQVIKTGRLTVYGNANNDDVIDSRDVSTVKKILNDVNNGVEWDNVEYQYADANYDQKITQEDVDITEKMSKKEHTELYYLNAINRVDKIGYPIQTLAGLGSYVLNGIVTLGLEDITEARNGSTMWYDSVFWGSLEDKFVISPKSNSIQTEKMFELIDKLKAEGKTLDALITTDSVLDNEDDFWAANVDVVKLPFGNDNEINAFLLLGYFTQYEESSHKYTAFYDQIMNQQKSLAEKYKDSVPSAFIVYNKKNVQSSVSNHSLIAKSIGVKNIWTYDPAKDPKDTVRLDGNDEWLGNPEWNADYIIGQEKMMYTPADDLERWNTYQDLLSVLDAMPNNCVIINDNMLEPLKVAYLMEYFFPDDVEKGFGDKIHQEFINTFIKHLSGNYDVTEDGVFCITYETVKDRLTA